MKTKILLKLSVGLAYLLALVAGPFDVALCTWVAKATSGAFHLWTQRELFVFMGANFVTAVGFMLGCLFGAGAIDRYVAARFNVATLLREPPSVG